MLRERQQYSGVGDATIARLAGMQPDVSDGNLFHDSLQCDYAV